jgi:anti-sigma regulatory factor (Ser/Thr protein kinase)
MSRKVVGSVEWSVSLSADAKAVGEARRQLSGTLCGRGIDRQHVQDALLVTSELVTNAVRHGSCQGDRVEVEFQLVQHRFFLCVRDAGRGHAMPHARALGAEHTTGRGLAIVSRLARWSQHEVRGGREVRAEMDF